MGKSKAEITENFTITASPEVMNRFKNLLTMMHLCSSWGHSNYFGMPLDGDGPDRFRVNSGINESQAKAIEKNMGGNLEVAFNETFGHFRIVRKD